jgi:hypothetical protein
MLLSARKKNRHDELPSLSGAAVLGAGDSGYPTPPTGRFAGAILPMVPRLSRDHELRLNRQVTTTVSFETMAPVKRHPVLELRILVRLASMHV